MRSWTRGWWCTLVVVILGGAVAGADVVRETAPSLTGATSVLMWVDGPDWALIDVHTGGLATPPSVADRGTTSGARLTWDLVRDETDELGMRHVVFRQRLVPAPGSVTLPTQHQGVGVPLSGAKLGFHYAADGRLKVVGGAMFEDVVRVDGLALVEESAAREMAEWVVRARGGTDVTPTDLLPSDLASTLRQRTELTLYSAGDGESFEFVWTVPLITTEGRVFKTAIHGRTGDLLAIWDPNPSHDHADTEMLTTLPSCEPAAASMKTAVGIPQNVGNVPNRSIYATAAADLQASYGNGVTHEGRLPRMVLPQIVSYFGVNTTTADQCPETGTQFYRRLPVKTVGTQRRYDDYFDLDREVPGRAAGDAYYKTLQTLGTFKRLGWNTFERLNLVVNSYHCTDNARFQTDADTTAPATSVVFCRVSKDSLYEHTGDTDFVADDGSQFLHSAAIDVVGHEIGHGMIFDTAEWVYDTAIHRQLHEGWADVLGLIAEWGNELPVRKAGSYEAADWVYGEDIYLDHRPTRRFDDDADDGAAPVGPNSLHFGDPPLDDDDSYQTALRIPLAFRLAVSGGYNPVCSRMDWLVGCDNPDGVDPLPQGDVTQAFFRALRIYGVHMHTFDDLAHYTALAAHDLWWQDFSTNPPTCTDATLQQHTMREAFEAVGHPAVGGFICTCQPDCDIYEW